MKNESIKLSFVDSRSDKIYQAELIEEGSGWLVNFAYGRRGSTLVTGTKTSGPVDFTTAKRTYDTLVKSKTAKGYKPFGVSAGIIVVDPTDTGIRPQLLNEIDVETAGRLIADDRYCMQEKNDGRRKLLSYTGSTVKGINKKGLETSVIQNMQNDCQRIQGAVLLDGEDMGTTIRLFDYLSYPNLTYKQRYEMLQELVPKHATTLRVVETAWTMREKTEMFAKLQVTKGEGVVFKLIDAPYSPGRPSSGGTQFKYKFTETASCIVISISSTKSSIGLAVLDENGDEVNVGNVTVYPNQKRPNLDDIVEVRYLYYFINGSLFQPVLLTVRDDVDKTECLLSKLKTKREEEEE